jgi:hypothetical protein
MTISFFFKGYQADKISHGLCLFLRYLYTFTMIPFFALLAPDHELPSVPRGKAPER